MSFRKSFDNLDLSPLPPLRRGAIRLAQFLHALRDQVHQDRVLVRASGLAFTSLLATVPVVVVILALSSAFGVLDTLEFRVTEALVERLVPAEPGELAAWLDRFTSGSGNLGFIGFFGLLVTAVLLLDSIESSFNDIWHVHRHRPLVGKISAYIATFVLGSLLIGASLSISARLPPTLERLGLLPPGWLAELGGWVLPTVLAVGGFYFLYSVVPYAQVRFGSALVGALTAALLWEMAKQLFAAFVSSSVRWSTLYGSLAVFPIFLLWLYVTWVIVLLGLEVAFTRQNFRALLRSRIQGPPTPRDRIATGLAVALAAARHYLDGQPPPNPGNLAEELDLPLELVDEQADLLVVAGLLRRVEGDDEGALVPSRPPQAIAVADVVGASLRGGRQPVSLPAIVAGEFAALERAVGRGRTLADLGPEPAANEGSTQ